MCVCVCVCLSRWDAHPLGCFCDDGCRQGLEFMRFFSVTFVRINNCGIKNLARMVSSVFLTRH